MSGRKSDERWRWVAGYEGRYMVSDQGRLIAVPTDGRDGVTMAPRISNGYIKATLSRNGEPESVGMHRLVARAFCPGYRAGLEVNHKNGDKADNRAENLEWVTRSENELHKSRVLKVGHEHRRARRFTDDQIREIRTSSIGTRPIARMFGVTPTAIRQIRTRKSYQEVI